MTVEQLIEHLTEELREVREQKDKLACRSYSIHQTNLMVTDATTLQWYLGRESALKETLILIKKNMK